MEFFEFVEFLLEETKLKLAHLRSVIKVNISLINEASVILAKVLEKIRKFEEEEHLSGIELAIHVHVENLKRVFSGSLVIFCKFVVLFMFLEISFFKSA